MTVKGRRLLPVGAGVLIALAFLVVRAAAPDPFERLRSSGFDMMQRLHPWQPDSAPVIVVDVDEASLRRIGQWPWPRNVVARMVTALQKGQASAIVFDAVFSEPDRTSPAVLAQAWSAQFGWRPPTGDLPDYDKDLEAAFARGRVVAGVVLNGDVSGAAPAIPASFATIGGDPAATITQFLGAVANLPALDKAAAGVGSFSITADRDQVVRSLPFLVALNGTLVPSLALESLRVAQDEDTIGVRAERGGGPSAPVIGYTVKVGDYQVPLESDGTLRLHHSARQATPTLSAWRVLDPAQGAAIGDSIRGRIVLIGTSAAGLTDLRETPLNPMEPGVNLHARGIEQVMAQHFLSRPMWAGGAEIVAGGALAVLLSLLSAFAPLRFAVLSTIAFAAASGLAVWLLFSKAGLLFDLSLVLPMMLASGVLASLARYFVAERDALRLRSAFKHYLSPDLVDVLAKEPDSLKLGGEAREMTFLFTDLQGFTALMENADPASAVALLNAYLDGLCAIAIDHGGTVDKIVGDALHVMFNAPLIQPDHAARGVRCALALDRFAQAFAAERQAEGVAFGLTRIGVNTGHAVVGNFGGSRRFDYTAHGDAINTAARLEAANKALGTRICVARSTAEQVTAIAFVPVGTLMLKGKTRGVDVFLPGEEADWQPDYRAAYARFAEGDETAGLSIVALHQREPDHPVLALHARRILAGERGLRLAA